MFSSFDPVNTPGIKTWDFTRARAAVSARVCLEDDCAPVQLFLTGGVGSSNIIVQLPLNSPPGKTVTIKNEAAGSGFQQLLQIADSTNQAATGNALTIGPGQAVTFVSAPSFANIAAPGFYGNSQWVAVSGAGCGPQTNAFASSVLSGSGGSVTNSFAVVAGGSGNLASGQYSAVGGGSSNTASGSNSYVGGGAGNAASGLYGVVTCGNTNSASGANSVVNGGAYGTTRNIAGYACTPASNLPIAATVGASQTGLLVLGSQTTDATSTVITSNGSAGAATNQLSLPNNSAYYVRGSVIANVTGGGNTKSWEFTALIKRGANAASTALVGTPTITSPYADAGASTWTVALSANTTSGCLSVTVTGQAATTIRWVCKLESTEVTF